MGHRELGRLAVLAGLALGCSVGALADDGAKRIDLLARSSENTVEAVSVAKLQLLEAVDVYNALFPATARNREKIHKKLQKELKSADKRVAKLTERGDRMNAQADKVLVEWASSAAAIQDPTLRAEDERRLREAELTYEEIRPLGQRVSELCRPFLEALRREAVAVGRDLTPESLAKRAPVRERLNAEADELVGRIDAEVTATKSTILALRS